MSRDRIAQAGIAIADDEGLEAVTMRRVAAALGVGTMSSYKHVADRDDLIVAMVDTITGRHPLPNDPKYSWQELTKMMALGDWDAFVRHPWLIVVWSTPRRRVDMASLEQLETMLERYEQAGLDRNVCYATIFGVAGLTLGMAALAIDNPGDELKSGIGLGEWRRQMGSDVERRLSKDEHGRAVRFLSDLHQGLGPHTFVMALDSFIAGVEARHIRH
ncbi:hypothetical protein GCM10023094_36290 [Rhodococcus olei]|uniref:HTH tetR-type domain-containing protein n=1 Tax=Rhodococcus olei TaxID=2161675 RepID=A0ABP8PBP4_9NOCA